MKASGFDPETAKEGETFPFHEDDLKYRHYKLKEEPCTNAVIFFVMDVSGSMTTDKKFLARSFYFLIYQFLRTKYNTIEIVFITHDVDAREVDENAFFTQSTSGGTMASSAIELVEETINKRFHPSAWNIYVFQCSDGDNYYSDNEKFLQKVISVKEMSQLYGYCEIDPFKKEFKADGFGGPNNIYHVLSTVADNKLKITEIIEKQDVWKAFKNILGGM